MDGRNFLRKIIIIINGKGGCGKDTLVKFAIDEYKFVWNTSAIDPIKDIAKNYGYDDNDKTEKSRKFLSDLKNVFVEWNNMPTDYLIGKAKEFYESDGIYSRIMFVHIREPKEIKKFKDAITRHIGTENDSNCLVRTMLVKNLSTDNKSYGNSSDDCVEDYNYDFTYYNYKNIYSAKHSFLLYLEDFVIPLLIESDITTVQKPKRIVSFSFDSIPNAKYDADEGKIEMTFDNGVYIKVPIDIENCSGDLLKILKDEGKV